MDYAKALTFVLDDTRWKEKIAIGTALGLVSMLLSIIIIGVLGFFILTGYSIRLLQNVRDGEEYPLPEWDDWGGDFIRGLKFAVVGIVWTLPIFIFAIPILIGGIIADGNGAASFFGAAILLTGSCLIFLYSLFVWLAAPGFSIGFATDERISSGLQFTEIWRWSQANIGQVAVAVIVVILASFVFTLVASIVGTLLCLIGLIVTVPLGMLALSLYEFNLFGQLAYQFPYGGFGGPVESAPAESTDLATSPDTAVVETAAAPTEPTLPAAEEPAESDDSAADDSAADDQTSEEDKPA